MIITDKKLSEILNANISTISKYLARAEFSHIIRVKKPLGYENLTETDFEKLQYLIHKTFKPFKIKGLKSATNKDRIAKMTTLELAKLLENTFLTQNFCLGKRNKCNRNCITCLEDWLQCEVLQ